MGVRFFDRVMDLGSRRAAHCGLGLWSERAESFAESVGFGRMKI